LYKKVSIIVGRFGKWFFE